MWAEKDILFLIITLPSLIGEKSNGKFLNFSSFLQELR